MQKLMAGIAMVVCKDIAVAVKGARKSTTNKEDESHTNSTVDWGLILGAMFPNNWIYYAEKVGVYHNDNITQ